ncbi:hypothetical protein SJAV_17890 [Sulfurisphaera javensis]|uniref:Radical SAM protein n=1 Tax=Sulfurisphaera javensis TaxID=2049879 RepID=A0AAT9GT00_9CREN
MILTSDYATFYSLPPLPFRLNLRRKYPPYGLRKVEAITGARIVPPDKLTEDEIIGVYVNDPFGLTEAAKGLTKIFKREPYYVTSFKEFSFKLREMKSKIIVGGPGAWELVNEDWIDHILIGEAETTLPVLLKKIKEGEKMPKVIYGEEAKKFYPIKGPSSMAEVEIMRKGRKIPLDIVKKELELQSKYHNYVNLISEDLLSYGDEKEVIDLLKLSSAYGKVIFSQISVISASSFNLSKLKEVLNLSERNFRSPVLSTNPGSCIFKIESEIIKELNKNFIYPMIYTDVSNVYDLMTYKTIIIPLPKNDDEDISKILLDVWNHDRKIIKVPFSRVIDYILRKNYETKGEYLKKLNLSSIFSIFPLIIKAYLFP